MPQSLEGWPPLPPEAVFAAHGQGWRSAFDCRAARVRSTVASFRAARASFVERRDQSKKTPGQRLHLEARSADRLSDRGSHRRPVRVPVALEVVRAEGVE